MADEVVSQLALDAAQVLQTLGQLNAAFAKYTQSLQNNAGASSAFNSAQNQIAGGINKVSDALENQKKLAADTANQLKSAFASGFANPTLAEIKKMNDAFASLQKTIISTKASGEQINSVLSNLGATNLTGVEARLQSAIIAAKQASQALGSSNARGTFAINEANVAIQAKEVAQIQAKAQAEASAQVAQQFAGRFSQVGADPSNINRFQIAVQRFQQVAQGSKLSGEQLTNVINNLGQVFSGAEGKVAVAALQVQRLGQTLSGVSTTATGFGLNFQSIIQRFTFLEALRGLTALQQAFSQAVPNAINFERQLAQIATISDSTDKNVDALGVRVTLLANEFGKPAPEVAAGLYHALSNQVGDTAQTVQFLTEALKFSKSAVTDVSSSVDALSGVQNAYGQSSAQASHNADVLFRTIDLGRVSAKELGDSFGRILPLAAQLGVSLEEVSAAISTATVQGVKFQDAQTQILNLLVEALKPTGAFTERMKELGFETAEAGIAAEGFVGFFSKIGENAKSSAELAKLFNNIRGLRGEISLFGDGGKKILDFLDQLQNSAGAAQKAFETVQFSNAEQVSNELAKIQNQITQGFGRDAVAALATLNSAFGGVADKVVVLGEVLAAALGGAIVFTAGSKLFEVTTSIAKAFGATEAAALSLGPVLGVTLVAAVGALTLAFKQMRPTDFAAEFTDGMEKARLAAAKFATDSANASRAASLGIRRDLDEQVKSVLSAVTQEQALYNSAFQTAKALQSAESDTFINQLNKRERALSTFINSVKSLQDNAAQNAKQLIQAQNEFELNIKQQQFAQRQENRTPDQQATALNQQINKLLNASKAAFQQGDNGFAKKAIDDASNLALQFQKITGNATLTNKVIEANRALTQATLAAEQQQVQAAQELEKSQGRTVNLALQQLELIKELNKQREKALGESGGADTDLTKSLDKQISAAAGKFDALVKNLNLGNLKVGGTQNQQTAIQNAQDALRKIQQGPSLQFSFQKGIDDFRAEVKRQFEAQPLAIELQLKFDPNHNTDLQNQITNLKKQIEKGLNSTDALAGAENNVKTAVDGISKAFEGFNKQLVEAANNAKGFQADGKTPLLPSFTNLAKQNPVNRAAVDQQLQKDQQALDTVQKKINDVFNDPKSFNEFGQLTAEAFTKIGDLLIPFKKIVRDATEPDADAFAKAFGAMAEKIIQTTEEAAKLRTTLQGVNNEIEAGNAAQGKLNLLDPNALKKVPDEGLNNRQKLLETEKELNDAVTTTDTNIQNATATIASAFNAPIIATEQLTQTVEQVGPAGVTAGEGAASGLALIGPTAFSQISGVISLTEALFQLAEAEALSGGGGGGGEFASRGAFMHYFGSGGQARGSDTVPAMLTPGEIVMNPRASRKFFSQLMAMNSGSQPSFLSNGGSVGNTFGDINVNITATSTADINARAIAKGIQREMRKGNIRRFS